MIAIATLLWSVEIVLAKRLLFAVSAPLLGAVRMGLGFVFLVGYLALTGRLAGLATIGGEALMWVLVTGVLLAGYVATWFGALRLAPATTVTCILVAGAVVTGALSSLSNGTTPDLWVVLGYILIVVAVALVVAATVGFRRLDVSRASLDG
jgi:uncharacterized membrane protein